MNKKGNSGISDAIKVDYLNIGLILVSLLLAYLIPFRLFLFAYAVIGPLHYVTEINWIRDKQYFTRINPWVWIAVILVVLLILPKLVALGQEVDPDSFWGKFNEWTDSLILVGFMLGLSSVFVKNNIQLGIVALIGAGLAIALQYVDAYHLIVGGLIPTLIHVYVFTILFMLYGALKSGSLPGKIAVALAAIVPLVIFYVDVDPIRLDSETELTFVSSGFQNVNIIVTYIFGSENFRESSGIAGTNFKVQVFIAFAYLYHYLNWFSKTTVIGWHKNLNWKKTLIMAGIWAISVSLFAYDYKIGLTLILGLSFLHVYLEFPVNAISIRGIFQHLLFGPKAS